MAISSGRSFDTQQDLAGDFTGPDEESGVVHSVVVNQLAVKYLNFPNEEAALNQIIRADSGAGGQFQFRIIGVSKDTQFTSLQEATRAKIFHLAPESNFIRVLTARFEGDSQTMMQTIDRSWASVMGNEILEVSFVTQLVDSQLVRERQEALLLISFATLAILIACLGLFDLASFTVHRRSREISLRKVMGAKVRDVVRLLLWQFSKPVLLANVIAWPIGVWAILRWLERFPYRLENWILLPICIAAGLVTLFIAWATVASNTRKIASAKPIESLRCE